MINPLQNDGPDGCQDRENFKSGRVWARRAQGGSGLALLLEQSPKSYAPLLRLLQGSGSRSRDAALFEVYRFDSSGWEPAFWVAGPEERPGQMRPTKPRIAQICPLTTVSNTQVRAYLRAMSKGIEKMERSASYLVRLQKNGEYTVVMSRPEWANREVPGFATEAEANAWIATRWRQSTL